MGAYIMTILVMRIITSPMSSKIRSSGFARFAEGAQGKAENNGKEDDLQHVALGEGIYGVHRHDVEQGLDQAGRRDLLCLQAFCGKIQPNAGLHDVGEEQTDGHGHAVVRK